jgi:hypothetical protein
MSAKKTLSEKTLSEANSGSKEKASKLRFKANPAAEVARVKKAVDQLHASVVAAFPVKPAKKIVIQTAEESSRLEKLYLSQEERKKGKKI